MKYDTGHYLLLLFTKHGDKAQTIPHLDFMTAQAEGEAMIKNPPYASFVVLRVLLNSIDRAFPWEVKDSDILDVEDTDAEADEEFHD